VPYRDPSKIKETGRELAVRPKLHKKTHNNQPEIDDSGRRDIGERAHGDGSMWEDIVPSFGDNWDNNKKYI
jgi:hypothetical protein